MDKKKVNPFSLPTASTLAKQKQPHPITQNKSTSSSTTRTGSGTPRGQQRTRTPLRTAGQQATNSTAASSATKKIAAASTPSNGAASLGTGSASVANSSAGASSKGKFIFSSASSRSTLIGGAGLISNNSGSSTTSGTPAQSTTATPRLETRSNGKSQSTSEATFSTPKNSSTPSAFSYGLNKSLQNTGSGGGDSSGGLNSSMSGVSTTSNPGPGLVFTSSSRRTIANAHSPTGSKSLQSSMISSSQQRTVTPLMDSSEYSEENLFSSPMRMINNDRSGSLVMNGPATIPTEQPLLARTTAMSNIAQIRSGSSMSEPGATASSSSSQMSNDTPLHSNSTSANSSRASSLPTAVSVTVSALTPSASTNNANQSFTMHTYSSQQSAKMGPPVASVSPSTKPVGIDDLLRTHSDKITSLDASLRHFSEAYQKRNTGSNSGSQASSASSSQTSSRSSSAVSGLGLGRNGSGHDNQQYQEHFQIQSDSGRGHYSTKKINSLDASLQAFTKTYQQHNTSGTASHTHTSLTSAGTMMIPSSGGTMDSAFASNSRSGSTNIFTKHNNNPQSDLSFDKEENMSWKLNPTPSLGQQIHKQQHLVVQQMSTSTNVVTAINSIHRNSSACSTPRTSTPLIGVEGVSQHNSLSPTSSHNTPSPVRHAMEPVAVVPDTTGTIPAADKRNGAHYHLQARHSSQSEEDAGVDEVETVNATVSDPTPFQIKYQQLVQEVKKQQHKNGVSSSSDPRETPDSEKPTFVLVDDDDFKTEGLGADIVKIGGRQTVLQNAKNPLASLLEPSQQTPTPTTKSEELFSREQQPSTSLPQPVAHPPPSFSPARTQHRDPMQDPRLLAVLALLQSDEAKLRNHLDVTEYGDFVSFLYENEPKWRSNALKRQHDRELRERHSAEEERKKRALEERQVVELLRRLEEKLGQLKWSETGARNTVHRSEAEERESIVLTGRIDRRDVEATVSRRQKTEAAKQYQESISATMTSTNAMTIVTEAPIESALPSSRQSSPPVSPKFASSASSSHMSSVENSSSQGVSGQRHSHSTDSAHVQEEANDEEDGHDPMAMSCKALFGSKSSDSGPSGSSLHDPSVDTTAEPQTSTAIREKEMQNKADQELKASELHQANERAQTAAVFDQWRTTGENRAADRRAEEEERNAIATAAQQELVKRKMEFDILKQKEDELARQKLAEEEVKQRLAAEGIQISYRRLIERESAQALAENKKRQDEELAKQQALHEQALREQALKEQALKEQALKEQALKEQALKEQALKEQALKEQALKEQALKEQALKEQALKEQAMRERLEKELAARLRAEAIALREATDAEKYANFYAATEQKPKPTTSEAKEHAATLPASKSKESNVQKPPAVLEDTPVKQAVPPQQDKRLIAVLGMLQQDEAKLREHIDRTEYRHFVAFLYENEPKWRSNAKKRQLEREMRDRQAAEHAAELEREKKAAEERHALEQRRQLGEKLGLLNHRETEERGVIERAEKEGWDYIDVITRPHRRQAEAPQHPTKGDSERQRYRREEMLNEEQRLRDEILAAEARKQEAEAERRQVEEQREREFQRQEEERLTKLLEQRRRSPIRQAFSSAEQRSTSAPSRPTPFQTVIADSSEASNAAAVFAVNPVGVFAVNAAAATPGLIKDDENRYSYKGVSFFGGKEEPQAGGRWLPWIYQLLTLNHPNDPSRPKPISQGLSIHRILSGDNRNPLDFMSLQEVEELCSQVKAVLAKEPNCLHMDLTADTDHSESTSCLKGEKTDELVIIGDIHGQFAELCQHVISHVVSPTTTPGTMSAAPIDPSKPRPSKALLFLGDFVDRGPQSVEVITLLFALKVTFPHKIHFIRGNHEVAETCQVYGFYAECRSKLQHFTTNNGSSRSHSLSSSYSVLDSYGMGHSRTMSCSDPGISAFYTYTSVFADMPLAAVVTSTEGNMFCCHGGLAPSLVEAARECKHQRVFERQRMTQHLEHLQGKGGTVTIDSVVFDLPEVKRLLSTLDRHDDKDPRCYYYGYRRYQLLLDLMNGSIGAGSTGSAPQVPRTNSWMSEDQRKNEKCNKMLLKRMRPLIGRRQAYHEDGVPSTEAGGLVFSDTVDGLLWSDPTPQLTVTTVSSPFSTDKPASSTTLGDGPSAPVSSSVESRYCLGFKPNNRGCGYTFGPDVFTEFCTFFDFDVVLRAHQLSMGGYHWDFAGPAVPPADKPALHITYEEATRTQRHQQCLTLFSAPNYGGSGNNLGAVLVVHRTKHDREYHITEEEKIIADTKRKKGIASQPKPHIADTLFRFIQHDSVPATYCSIIPPPPHLLPTLSGALTPGGHSHQRSLSGGSSSSSFAPIGGCSSTTPSPFIVSSSGSFSGTTTPLPQYTMGSPMVPNKNPNGYLMEYFKY